MSRSTSNRKSATSTSSTRTPAPAKATVREEMVHTARSIKNYTFEYQRDRISRRAGSSYFRLESNTGNGPEIEMSLQEAQSLYNFLHNALNR